MPRSAVLEVPLRADLSAARAARLAVSAHVRELLDPDRVEVAVLCTSEVVTNAVEHGRPPIELRVEVDDTRVRVSVRDGSELPPVLRDPDHHTVRGRGILLLERCAHAWGCEAEDDPAGKSVWFEMLRG